MGYRIKEDEGVEVAVRRIVLEQVDRAQDRLELKTRNKDRAVHDARVSFKKIRAALRLIRGSISSEAFKNENTTYRDLGRQLATSRDTTVVATTLEEMVHHFNKQLVEPDVKTLRKRLRRSRAEQRLNKDILVSAAAALTIARQRINNWSLEKQEFAAISEGLQRSYRHGRQAFKLASGDPTTENLHEWRKQVKHLLYQVTVLNPIWPKMLDSLARELNKLADYLSEDHDLALLRRRVFEQPPSLGQPEDIERLLLLIDNRRIQLETKAVALGSRLYAEKPRQFVARFAAYWRAWRSTSITKEPIEQQAPAVYEARSGAAS